MARLSITDQLADLRRAYTGENLSQAVPATHAVIDGRDRDELVAALRGEIATKSILSAATR